MATHVFFSGDTPDGETSSTYTIPAGETATVSVDAEGHRVHSVLQVKQPISGRWLRWETFGQSGAVDVEGPKEVRLRVVSNREDSKVWAELEDGTI
jgi:hypothetical protein